VVADDPHIACGIYPFILKDTKFIDACAWHDAMFELDSFLQRKDWTRKQVDRWFLNQMLLISKTRLDRAQAYLFYGIARLFGGPFYEGK
jgi:hypothetical protein